MVRLFFYSVLTVAFSYILAEIIYVVVQMVEVDPTEAFSVSSLRTTAVVVTPWPTFLGGVARAIACTGAIVLGFGTVGGLLAPARAGDPRRCHAHAGPRLHQAAASSTRP